MISEESSPEALIIPFRLLIESLKTRWYWRVAIVLLALSGSAAGLIGPFFQKAFVDQLLGHPTALATQSNLLDWLETLNSVSPMGLVFFAFVATMFAQGFTLLAGFVGMREGLYLQSLYGERLYRKMLSIRSDAMGSTTVGEIVSIYATDVAGSTAVVDQTLPIGANIIFAFTFAPIAIAIICGIPIWATLLVMALVVGLNTILGARQAAFFHRFKQLAAERTGLVNEWVQNIRLLRILGWVENFERKIFVKREEETVNRLAMVTNGQMMNAFGSSISFVINLVGVATLVSVSEARGTTLSPGQLFSMLWIFGVFLSRPFRQIPWIFTFTLDGLSSMRRVERFLDRPSDEMFDETIETERAKNDDKRSLNPALSVRSLNLQIGARKILDDVSFDVAPGEFVAIVGEVGSGKSMLILSLLGETAAQFGQYRLLGQDALPMSLNERRRHFAFVAQDGFVMSASLRENVMFRYLDEQKDFNDERVLRSLSRAQFRVGSGDSEFTGSRGLDTEIGERGVNLSGGQRQRVALARAHFLDRSILLLDDCLSAVDVDTERKLIDQLIAGDWKNRARLLVTHRLSVLERVDRVLFVEEGKIVEQGKFSDLLVRSQRVRDFVASVKRSEEVIDQSKANALPKLESEEKTVETSALLKGEDGVETESLS